MNRYDLYKDSGVEWIGKIPNHWVISKLKYSTEITMGQSPNSDSYNDEGVGFPFLQGNSEFGISHPKHKLSTTEITKKSRIGDVLFSVRGSVGEINWSNIEYCIGRGLCSISPQELESKVLWYLLLFSKDEFLSNSVGSTFVSVTTDDVKNLQFPLPPLSEQQQIVSFLDTKTSLIDSLIEKTQQKIELLKEKRTSLINEVVTKGLNPNVEMKDSGVEWIGEIPSSWTIPKMSYLLEGITDGTHGTHERVNEGKLFLSSKNITNKGVFIGKNESHITTEEHEKIVKKGYPVKGDILITVVGSIGRSCVYEYDYPISFQRSVCFLRFKKKINEYFMNFLIHSDVIQFQLLKNTKKSTQGGIYMNDLKRFDIILPSLPEQQQIVEHLDEQTQKIDKTISIEEKRIELLKEYRQSLISEVVTGKRKVVE